jgi:hypothetical protein
MMTTLLLSVLAATSLVAAGVGNSETRSVQALPADHLVTAPAHATGKGNFHRISRMTDASPATWDYAKRKDCDEHKKEWNVAQRNCHRTSPVVYIIGGATIGGIVYSFTSREDPSTGQDPVSN